MVALYTEGFCITNICFSLDIYVKLIKSLPNQATQLTASPPPLGTEKDRKSKSSSFLSSVPKYKYRVLLFNYSMFIFLQETQISFDLYAAVICVALKQNKHASELPLLGKNIPKDHDGIFPPVLPTSISVPPIDINLALFPSGNCVIFSIFLDNRLLFNNCNTVNSVCRSC